MRGSGYHTRHATLTEHSCLEWGLGEEVSRDQGAYEQALAQIDPQIDAWLERGEGGMALAYDSEGLPSQALDNALLRLLGQEKPVNSTVAISATEEMELFLRWKEDLDDLLEEEQAPVARRPRP